MKQKRLRERTTKNAVIIQFRNTHTHTHKNHNLIYTENTQTIYDRYTYLPISRYKLTNNRSKTTSEKTGKSNVNMK